MSAPLFDARGCLTDAGIAEFSRSAVGKAPPELAQHLSRCPMCQRRSLVWGAPPRTKARQRIGIPVALAAAAILLLALLALTLGLRLIPHA